MEIALVRPKRLPSWKLYLPQLRTGLGLPKVPQGEGISMDFGHVAVVGFANHLYVYQ